MRRRSYPKGNRRSVGWLGSLAPRSVAPAFTSGVLSMRRRHILMAAPNFLASFLPNGAIEKMAAFSRNAVVTEVVEEGGSPRLPSGFRNV